MNLLCCEDIVVGYKYFITFSELSFFAMNTEESIAMYTVTGTIVL